MNLHCDQTITLHIATNPMYHERAEHIEVDYNFTREVTKKEIPSLSEFYVLYPKSYNLYQILRKRFRSM